MMWKGFAGVRFGFRFCRLFQQELADSLQTSEHDSLFATGGRIALSHAQQDDVMLVSCGILELGQTDHAAG